MGYHREWWEDPGNRQLGGRSASQVKADKDSAKKHGSHEPMCKDGY